MFGPDGVGKSSISSAVVGALGPLFDHQRTLCWRPQLIRSRIAKEPHRFKLPHDAAPHGPVKSMLKITAACLDFAVDHATLTRNQLRGCTLIAWDRYLYDLAVDEKRYRYRGPAWYSDLILRSLPIPEHFLGIILDADENTILNRKQELPLEELQRQRLAYRRLAARLPETHIVKNDRDFDTCLRRVLSLAIGRMAGWFEPVADELFTARQ
jgi:thymidylate kinase